MIIVGREYKHLGVRFAIGRDGMATELLRGSDTKTTVGVRTEDGKHGMLTKSYSPPVRIAIRFWT